MGIFRNRTRAQRHTDATNATGLSGWDGIEAHINDNDDDKMEGYSDDMDTLLVFAGLFSAILTAFVVQTYPLLQPSSTDITNQLLAANNRMLVQGFTAILTGISSGPLTSLLVDDPPPFQPRTSARWINCLFFTSLVLSLAAALFAILIKQWIREYMEWSSPLSLPRENVLVRQWRFESWETWSIAAVISTVPAFLEIAMILFLIGIIILLWTMDNIVAICVTVVIAGFLLVVAIFTVLPVFFRRCPYKSPTAWALVLASYGLPLFATYCLSWCTLYAALLRKDWASGSSHTSPGARHGRRGWYMSEFARYVRSTIRILSSAPDPSLNNLPKWTSLPRRWRELDLAACRSSGVRLGDWKASMEQLEIAAEEAIESESQDSVEETREVQDRRALVNTLIINIRESSILHRALSWVTTSSQNSHIIDYINQCSQIEAEGSHRSGLQGLLCLGKQIGSVDKGWHLSLLEFIISGGQSSTGSHSELLLKIYPETLENYKVRMSAETGNLVVLEGQTHPTDYESLLLSYFTAEIQDGDNTRLEMFIFTAGSWLSCRYLSEVRPENAKRILDQMAKAADLLLAGADRGPTKISLPADLGDNHLDWITELSVERETLTRQYGAMYRQILHSLEKAFKRGALRGDQPRIRKSLHRQLKTSHAPSAAACETAACPWTSHHCISPEPFTLESTCQLLRQEELPEEKDARRRKARSRFVALVIAVQFVRALGQALHKIVPAMPSTDITPLPTISITGALAPTEATTNIISAPPTDATSSTDAMRTTDTAHLTDVESPVDTLDLERAEPSRRRSRSRRRSIVRAITETRIPLLRPQTRGLQRDTEEDTTV